VLTSGCCETTARGALRAVIYNTQPFLKKIKISLVHKELLAGGRQRKLLSRSDVIRRHSVLPATTQQKKKGIKKYKKEGNYSRRERALSVVSSHSTLVPAAALIMPVCVCVCVCVCVSECGEIECQKNTNTRNRQKKTNTHTRDHLPDLVAQGAYTSS